MEEPQAVPPQVGVFHHHHHLVEKSIDWASHGSQSKESLLEVSLSDVTMNDGQQALLQLCAQVLFGAVGQAISLERGKSLPTGLAQDVSNSFVGDRQRSGLGQCQKSFDRIKPTGNIRQPARSQRKRSVNNVLRAAL